MAEYYFSLRALPRKIRSNTLFSIFNGSSVLVVEHLEDDLSYLLALLLRLIQLLIEQRLTQFAHALSLRRASAAVLLLDRRRLAQLVALREAGRSDMAVTRLYRLTLQAGRAGLNGWR